MKPYHNTIKTFKEIAEYSQQGKYVKKNRIRGHHNSTNASYSEIVSVSIFSSITVLLSILIGVSRPEITGREDILSLLSLLLVMHSCLFMVSIVIIVFKSLSARKRNSNIDLILYLLLSGILFLFTIPQKGIIYFLLFWWLIITLIILIQRLINKSYSIAGHLFYLSFCAEILIGLIWMGLFFATLDISGVTKTLIFISTPLLLVSIPSGYLRLFEVYDVLCRDHWHRPRHPFPENWHKYEPFISIHVPTYSEPSDLVIQTLNKLKEIDYSNYEVIVIDNNTRDESLWLPVKIHCEKLGSKFRFMHEMGVSGAKAGALNLIHDRIDHRATIIAVIDADYQVEANFVKDLVGYFQNPKVGFVQTPHDYRDWDKNSFMTMCYWEYRLFFHSVMIGLNERDAGITVGTMCLVRKEALEKAGGWSEWCVTEDSELAIRVHDAGYTSVYVDKTYGRGLIPDTFEGYKIQRYRWTAGPVQEFRHYFGHFIGISGKDSNFNFFQRMFHLNHGLGNFLNAFSIPLLLIGMSIVASMIYHHEIIAVPIELWLAASITLLASPILIYSLYKLTLRASFFDILMHGIAVAALSHVVYLSSLQTAISGNAKWIRTNKFKSNQSYWLAILSTKEELILSILIASFVLFAWIAFPYNGFSTMFLIGLGYVVVRYLAAPLMALLAVYDNRHQN